MAPPEPMTLEQPDLDGRILIRLIRRRFRMIAALTLALTLLALPVILAQKRPYSAVTQVLIHPPSAQTLLTGKDAPSGGVDLDIEMQRVGARDNIKTVIARFGLDGLPEFNPALRPPGPREWLNRLLRRKGGIANGDPALAVMAEVYNSLGAYRIGTTSVAEIRFASTDPVLAAKVANGLVAAYLDRRNAGHRTDTLAARAWLENRRAFQAQRFAAARNAARDFQASNRLATDPATTEAALSLVAMANRQADLQRRRSLLREDLAAASAATSEPTLVMTGEPESLGLLRTELRAQESVLAQLGEKYGDDYAPVAALSERLQGLRAQIAAGIAAHAAGLSLRLDALDREAALLETRMADVLADVSRQSTAAIELASLLRVADTEAATLATLDGRLQEVSAELSMDAVEVEVLVPATVPLWPQGRSRSFYLVLAMLTSGLLALTLAGLRDVFDTRMRRQAELAPLARVRPVGLLPLVPARILRTLPETIQHRPDSFLRDAVRDLLEAVEAGPRPLRSLAVTSVRAGDGASTVAAALSLALAAADRRVLLVACDTGRKPRRRLPGMRAAPARRPPRPADTADRAALDTGTGVEHLRRLEPGPGFFPAPAEVAEILSRAEAGDVTVIFDAPPVLAGPAARLPAGLADRVLLVIRWGTTPRRLVALAAERVRHGPNGSVMTVLNAVNYRRHALYGISDAAAFAALAKVSRS